MFIAERLGKVKHKEGSEDVAYEKIIDALSENRILEE